MGRPKSKEEYRAELAETFANILEEKGLSWRKEWNGKGGGAPHNGVTKANYRGCNAFWLSLIAMSKGYTDPRWVTMHQIMDPDKKYHTNEKWHLKKGSKATYVEYWYPYDVKNKKAMTWEEYREDLENGRNEKEFTLATRYTAVFNAHEELVAEMCSCFMGTELKMEATSEHIENHKAYVQPWIGAIREKPEILIKAIKDAQAAANYMDYKAGLITEKEYEKVCGAVMEVKQNSREMER